MLELYVVVWNAVLCLVIDLAYTAFCGFREETPKKLGYRIEAYSAYLIAIILYMTVP